MLSHTFTGGLVIDNPYPIQEVRIVQAPLPGKVVLPLQQRIGSEAVPCVNVGDKVLTGQVIASTEDSFCVPIHASISGTVVAIDDQYIPHKSDLKSTCITIESDGKDQWITHKDFNLSDPMDSNSTTTLIDYIHSSGIIGLGGAGYPTHNKVARTKDCHTLIINGTECEPGIMCDDALMQQKPREIIKGIEILLQICGASRAIIAVEDDKPEAIHSLSMYINNERISIQQIPTKYTSGTEKLLIKALLDIEVPSGGYAADVGVLCQNVATTKAIFDAVVDSRPLVSRIVTITGSGIEKPNNYEVRIGASFDHIISMSQPNNNSHTMRMGGMMMGIDVKDINTPICKITNCIFVNNKSKPIPVQACIRCGACSDVCPVDLLPQQLYWYSKNEDIDKAMDYNLIDCIECRCCDYVCPSQIPLAEYFAFAKALHRKQTIEKEHIDLARERFEYREYRLERNKKEKAEMMAAKKEELKKKMANDKAQKDKIAAAMARVNNKKANNKDA